MKGKKGKAGIRVNDIGSKGARVGIRGEVKGKEEEGVGEGRRKVRSEG